MKLVYNEIFKQVKKLSFIICLILLISLAIGYPILQKLFTNTFTYLYTNDDIKYYEDIIKNNDNDYEGKLINELYQIKIDSLKTAVEQKIAYNDFRFYLLDNLVSSKQTIAIIDRLLNGEELTKIERIFNLNYEKDKYWEIYFDISILEGLSPTELKELKESNKNYISDCEKAIAGNDYLWFLNQQLADIKKELENAPDEESKKINENQIKLYELLIKEKVNDPKDFRIKELDKINEAYMYLQETKLTEKEFKNIGYRITYKEYSKLYDQNIEAQNEQIAKSWYAIENNINYEKTGARSSFEGIANLSVPIIGLIIIIIAGGIVSNEFQKGTIRLLVIRPHKRWKILFSKLLAILIIAIALVFIITILAFVTSGIIYGFNDFGIKMLISEGNKIIEVNYLIFMLKNISILVIPILFVALGSFTLSTITNNTAISVGFSIFVFIGSSLILRVLYLLNIPFMDYTFLPYLDYSIFLTKINIVTFSINFQMLVSFIKGNIILIIWSIIFYTVSSFIFIKKDIRN